MRDVPVLCMSIAEAAVATGIGRKQIEEWIFSGALPAFSIGENRGKIKILTKELIAFLQEKSDARDGIKVTSPIIQIIKERRKKKEGIA